MRRAERELIVDIEISRDKYLRWYSGTARYVYTVSRSGVSVKFPASILRPYVGHDGIHGTFAIRFGADRKFHDIRKVN